MSEEKADEIRKRFPLDLAKSAIDVIEHATDLPSLELGRGILAANVEYLKAMLERTEPGITRNPFLDPKVEISVRALHEVMLEQVRELLGGQFQITEVDGNMVEYAVKVVEAVIARATR